MSADEMVRWVVVGAAIGLALLVLLGGMLTPIAGSWRDGERLIRIRQVGPWLRGLCELPGGGEHYKGFALFGRVTLHRYEYGREHLLAAGFTDETIPLIAEQPMARFLFRRCGRELRGTFEGRVFTFAHKPPKIIRVATLEPQKRVWKRQ